MYKCKTCEVELELGKNWGEGNYYNGGKDSPVRRCLDCERTRSNEINRLQMRVNGKYISNKHPLYKPGNYKSFSDAAFSSLQNYTKCDKGEVYIIKNPAWKNWYKIGKAVDSTDRCNSYQTSSPHRDYVLVTSIRVADRGKAEREAHTIAERLSKKRSNEWFYIENLGKEDFDTMIMEKLDGRVSVNTKSA